MGRRHELLLVTSVLSLCMLFALHQFIVENQSPSAKNRMGYDEPGQQQQTPSAAWNWQTLISSAASSSGVDTIEEVIAQQRNIVESNLKSYQKSAKDGDGNYKDIAEEYLMERGGQPIRTIVAATWRSGSTFLGDVLNAVPATYYHYEPLLDLGIVQVRGPPLETRALRSLTKLLHCNYTLMDDYLEFGRAHSYLFTHNFRLWNVCEAAPHLCWQSRFLNQMCRLFPFQIMKTVRIRLRLLEKLLNDDSLNVKVVLLVRDPRGTLQSRKHRDWCPGEPDCDNPNLLCADMVSDYSAAIQLQKRFPDRFRALRYEDMSLNPKLHIQQLFDFLHLHMHPDVIAFLDSHTKENIGGVSSTYRDSKIAPFHWRSDLNYTEVQFIEDNCLEAMKLWGYVRAHNETHLREFNPLTSFSIE